MDNLFRCSCPKPGLHKECHCRAEKYGLSFTSDDWCNCQCHHRDEIIAKLAFLELAKELDALSDLDAFVNCSKELAMVAEMIRSNQFDQCTRDACERFLELAQPKP